MAKILNAELCSKEVKEWAQNIKAGGRDAVAAFILALPPNVEEVNFNAYMHIGLADKSYFWPLFANAADLQAKGGFSDDQLFRALENNSQTISEAMSRGLHERQISRRQHFRYGPNTWAGRGRRQYQ